MPHSFQTVCRCLQQYSYPKLFQLTHEKCTESSRFTSDFEHLASSHISQTSMGCRRILAYIVTPLPNITKVLFNKNIKILLCTGSRKQSHSEPTFELVISQGANAVLAYSYCLPSQPRSSPAILLFLAVLCTMVYLGGFVPYLLLLCVKANSEDVIFLDFNVLKYPLRQKRFGCITSSS